MDTLAYMASASQDNTVADKKSVYKMAETFGAQEAQGANSRPALARLAVEAAKRGTLSCEKPKAKGAKSDVGMLFEHFARGNAAKAGVGYVPQSSEVQQVSKLMAFAKLGALPQVNGVEVFTRAAEIIAKRKLADAKDPIAKRPYDSLLAVARAQVSLPDSPLTDAQIEGAMVGDEADVKIEADRLDSIIKSMQKLIDADDLPGKDPRATEQTAKILEIQIGQLNARIIELGGTSAAIKARAAAIEAQKAAAAKLAGLQVKTMVEMVTL